MRPELLVLGAVRRKLEEGGDGGEGVRAGEGATRDSTDAEGSLAFAGVGGTGLIWTLKGWSSIQQGSKGG